MKRFRYHQRITITDTAHPLHNRTGRVVQLRSKGAWVAMSEDVADILREFPSTDARRDWIALKPGQCESAEKGKSK